MSSRTCRRLSHMYDQSGTSKFELDIINGTSGCLMLCPCGSPMILLSMCLRDTGLYSISGLEQNLIPRALTNVLSDALMLLYGSTCDCISAIFMTRNILWTHCDCWIGHHTSTLIIYILSTHIDLRSLGDSGVAGVVQQLPPHLNPYLQPSSTPLLLIGHFRTLPRRITWCRHHTANDLDYKESTTSELRNIAPSAVSVSCNCDCGRQF